jgi:hypothetical protein
MLSHTCTRFLISLAGLLIALAVPTAQGAAHGGGTPRLVNQPAGPYQLSAWTQPDPIRTGDLHVTAAVTEPGSGAPNLFARVEVAIYPSGAAEDLRFVEAFRGANPNKLLHDVDLGIPASGDYQVTIRVTGSAGTGQAGFELSVLPASRGVPEYGVVLMGALAIGLILVSIHLFFPKSSKPSIPRIEQPVTPNKEAIL